MTPYTPTGQPGWYLIPPLYTDIAGEISSQISSLYGCNPACHVASCFSTTYILTSLLPNMTRFGPTLSPCCLLYAKVLRQSFSP